MIILKNKIKILLLISIFLSVFYIFSLNNRNSHVDEAVIAGQSYFLNTVGFVKSDLYAGYGQGWDKRQYFYHKFFVILGSISMKIFGFSIYSFKIVPLLFLVIFLIFLKKYIDIEFNNIVYFYTFFIIFLGNTYICFYSFLFRPEIVVMCFGFLSYLYLSFYLKTNKLTYVILSGIFAGFAVFTHLNGLIFCFAGFFLLLYNKKIKSIFWFTFFATFFSLFYFWDIRTIDDLKMLYIQFTTDPNVLQKDNFFMSILNEQKRFFHSDREISLTVLFLFSLFFDFKAMFLKHKNLFIYTFFLIIFLMLVAAEKTSKYAILYYPQIISIITIFILNLKNKSKKLKYFFLIFFIGYIGIHLYHNIELINDKLDVPKRSQQIADFLNVKHVRVIGPESFIFNQITNYKIWGHIGFAHYYAIHDKSKENDVYEYLNFSNINNILYVIIDKRQDKNQFDFNLIKTFYFNQIINGYKLVVKEDDIYIFKKIT